MYKLSPAEFIRVMEVCYDSVANSGQIALIKEVGLFREIQLGTFPLLVKYIGV